MPKFNLKFPALVAALVAMASVSQAAHHLKLVYESEPTGPNQVFYVDMVMVEHDKDVIALQLRIGYNSSRGDYTDIQDNTGQAANSLAVYGRGTGTFPLSGVSYADSWRLASMDAVSPVIAPINAADPFYLGRIQFTTSANYTTADGRFGVYVTNDTDAGVWDEDVRLIPAMVYQSLDPVAAVSDWAMY